MDTETSTYILYLLPGNVTSLMDNSSVGSSHPMMVPSRALEVTRLVSQRVLIPFFVCGGVIGNIFNIIVLRDKQMRSSTNVYLTALALCDTFYLIFMLALSIIQCSNRELPWGLLFFHPIGRVLSDMLGNTAVWLTVAFTLERYVGVCHPMKGKAWCTIKKAKLAAITVAIFCVATTSPEFFELEIVQTPDTTSNPAYYKCQRTPFGKSDSYQIVYFWWYVAFFTIIPLILLSVFNSTLIGSVWKANKARRTLSNTSVIGETTRQATEQQKVTTMLIAVVIIFLLCQLPWTILLLYKAYMNANNIPMAMDAVRITGNISNILVIFNASINFLLYSYFSSRFRRVFKRLMCDWVRKKRNRRKSLLSTSSDMARRSGSSKESTSASSGSCRSKKALVSDPSVQERLINPHKDENRNI